MHTDTFTKVARGSALAAAPLGFVLLAVAIAAGMNGETNMASPAVIAANVAGLGAALALLLGLVWAHLHTRAALGGRGSVAMTIAIIGAGLVVGAAWSSVFVAPALELAHPGLVNEPLDGVIAGYMISHTLLGLGVLGWAVPARRAGVISKAAGAVLVVGGMVCLVPLPARFILVAVGLLIVVLRDRAPVAERSLADA